MNSTAAGCSCSTVPRSKDGWRPVGAAEPALLGRSGMGWSHFFREWRRGEPYQGRGRQARACSRGYPIGHSFGTVPSSRLGHLHVTNDTVCVHDK